MVSWCQNKSIHQVDIHSDWIKFEFDCLILGYRYLSENAVKVQKVWRGFQGRRHFRQVLDEKVRQLKLDHYNRMAVIVNNTEALARPVSL